MDPRFIIFSLPRSGSTTLLRSLNLHRDIRALYEPSFIGVSTRVGLQEALRDLLDAGRPRRGLRVTAQVPDRTNVASMLITRWRASLP